MDGITANASDDGTGQTPRAGEPRRVSMSPANLSASTAAGIIVLIALAILIAIRFGFAGALGD